MTILISNTQQHAIQLHFSNFCHCLSMHCFTTCLQLDVSCLCLQEDWNLFQATKRQVMKLKMSEYDEEYAEESEITEVIS